MPNAEKLGFSRIFRIFSGEPLMVTSNPANYVKLVVMGKKYHLKEVFCTLFLWHPLGSCYNLLSTINLLSFQTVSREIIKVPKTFQIRNCGREVVSTDYYFCKNINIFEFAAHFQTSSYHFCQSWEAGNSNKYYWEIQWKICIWKLGY